MSRAVGEGGWFDDALLGADGTADPGARRVYRDALAEDAAPATEWGVVVLPRLPVAPGGDERTARALVENDELPAVGGAPAAVPAGQWGRLQPAPGPPRRPGPTPSWSAPAGWPGSTPGRPPGSGWQAPSGPRPTGRTVPRPAEEPVSTRRSSASSVVVVLAVVLLLLLLGLVLLS